MSTDTTRIFLGIDWGTHSSKWACSLGPHRRYFDSLPIYSSDLVTDGESMIFGAPEKARSEDDLIKWLKGLLINDPLGSSFWASPRADTGTSLGEAVAFSLCCLLSDAKQKLVDQLDPNDLSDLELGFSFPNWLVDRGRGPKAAARNFCQAVAASVDLFSSASARDLPQPRKPYSVQRWKEVVSGVRPAVKADSVMDLAVENMTTLSFGPTHNGVTWRFLTESAAAGLPYLRATKIEEVPGAPGLAKILVVDVGAGSTDVGYMLRVRNRKTQDEGFYYFPPASSFKWAGNDLTNEIMKYHSARGTPLTYAEAEARKLRQTDWVKLSFVEVWKARICDHVSAYIDGVTDERWLPLPVSLNLVVTGGSGLVPGLRESLREAVCAALLSRRCEQRVVDKVRLSGEHIPRLDFATEAEYARRAVCLGAADHDKPGVRYMAKMDRPVLIQITTPPRWV